MTPVERARKFLGGTALPFDQANQLWKDLKQCDELSFARRVLERIRAERGINGDVPADKATRDTLCQQEALMTSKDCELLATLRHDRALQILSKGFGGNLRAPELDGDPETLGIAGGILKRRWNDLGQIEDLRQAVRFYERGASNSVGVDAYPHINAAFLNDLLAHAGDDPDVRRQRADALRERILHELPDAGSVPAARGWFNTATRAEALFGLRRYDDATNAVSAFTDKPAPWELETTARQLAALAHLQESQPLQVPEIRRFFEALLPGAADAARSAMVGKVGLALSGGGFRASFYHLGVLARLAELNVLRHIEVLSCVSGGSIVGACYWLALRKRLKDPAPMTREDYVGLVLDIISRFLTGVATNVRGAVQPSKFRVAWRLFNDQKGALDPELTARALDQNFYQPLMEDKPGVAMHELIFTPGDHAAALRGAEDFQPGKHNWLRANKVPMLVLNATTVNTGHAWQFTPTWMGESPWAIHEEADSIPRLQWSWYDAENGWTMEVARAVAASACVPGVFAPLEIPKVYDGIRVQLVDGGVNDNQGTVSLLALSCNVVLVSDACGQLLLEKEPTPGLKGLASYANRSMSMVMERVRLANYADLAARQRVGLLRGLMFLHMKAGLDADPIRLPFSQESYDVHREALSPSGVRKDLQQALAELRTDLDAFTKDESYGLMACGYQMATWAFERDLSRLKELWDSPVEVEWPFTAMLRDLTSPDPPNLHRRTLLKALQDGSSVSL